METLSRPENNTAEIEIREDLLPEMMFAPGEEPVGVRVLTYQSSRALKRIFNTLDEDERRRIEASSFGKLLQIAEKPAFSSRFARYMMSRQLKVEKKFEVWFRFAGQPIRFSLREFAIVTGLPCGPYPARSRMKMKGTVTEKPYWPDLFGTVEVVTVESVVKMLRKKTVKDKEIRVKYACLAILSSVLLPTNLKMKISREHAEAIQDLDEFFQYPWGRAAFEMLIRSIKERDVVSLSQNTIVIKGFALAIQLVLVAAVPSLTEAFQEADSSSESESDDNNEEGGSRRKTLSPNHARNMDKMDEVVVRGLLEDEEGGGTDETLLRWREEVGDPKVDYIKDLISKGVRFPVGILKGGAKRTDVEKLKIEGKGVAKARKSKNAVGKGVVFKAVVPPVVEVNKVTGMVTSLEGKVSGVMKAIEATNKLIADNDDAVRERIVEEIAKVRSELMERLKEYVGNLIKTHMATMDVGRAGGPAVNVAEKDQTCTYEESIRDVLDNLHQYMTPPKTTRTEPHLATDKGDETGSEAGPEMEDTPMAEEVVSQTASSGAGRQVARGLQSTVNILPARVDNVSVLHKETRKDIQTNNLEGECGWHSASSGTAKRGREIVHTEVPLPITEDGGMNEVLSNGDIQDCPFAAATNEMVADTHTCGGSRESGEAGHIKPVNGPLEVDNPTFSLELTQELAGGRTPTNTNIATFEPFAAEAEEANPAEDTQIVCRKSKRHKTIPQALLNDYQCPPILVSRARQNQAKLFCKGDEDLANAKFEKLETKLCSHFIISVSGLVVSAKDLIEIIERKRVLPGRIVDILVQLVATLGRRQGAGDREAWGKFLDTKFMVSVARAHPRFANTSNKYEFVFPRSMMENMCKSTVGGEDPMRYYFPFNLGKKNWVGVVVDCTSWSVIVLDCNTSHCSEEYLEGELEPLTEMFPYMLKQSLHIAGGGELESMKLSRPKGLCQNIPIADTGVMAILMLGAYAANGIEGCWGIGPDNVGEEARAAAVTAYELLAPL